MRRRVECLTCHFITVDFNCFKIFTFLKMDLYLLAEIQLIL